MVAARYSDYPMSRSLGGQGGQAGAGFLGRPKNAPRLAGRYFENPWRFGLPLRLASGLPEAQAPHLAGKVAPIATNWA